MISFKHEKRSHSRYLEKCDKFENKKKREKAREIEQERREIIRDICTYIFVDEKRERKRKT